MILPSAQDGATLQELGLSLLTSLLFPFHDTAPASPASLLDYYSLNDLAKTPSKSDSFPAHDRFKAAPLKASRSFGVETCGHSTWLAASAGHVSSPVSRSARPTPPPVGIDGQLVALEGVVALAKEAVEVQYSPCFPC